MAVDAAPKTVRLEEVLTRAAGNRGFFKRLLRNPGKTLAAEGLALGKRDLNRLDRMRKLLRRPVVVALRRGDVVPKRIRPTKIGDWNPEWPTEWARTRYPGLAFVGKIKFVGPR